MPYVSSNGRRCVVTGCTNTEKSRYLLLNSKCNLHRQLRKNCKCENVFKFHKFPTDPLKRKVWVKNVDREDVNFLNSRRASFVVCSIHFPDGQPTKEHPYPILHMDGPSSDSELGSPGRASTLSSTQDPDAVEKEVLYIVTSLCDIVSGSDVSEDVGPREGSSRNRAKKVPSTSQLSSFSEDSLSARRDRRTIKKTFKARSFEAEKLFNRIRFGRPENRSLLLPLLRKTIGLPKLKECFIKLHRFDVESPVKLSDLRNHPVLSRELEQTYLTLKIDSVGSLSKGLSGGKNVLFKKKHDSSYILEGAVEDPFFQDDDDDVYESPYLYRDISDDGQSEDADAENDNETSEEVNLETEEFNEDDINDGGSNEDDDRHKAEEQNEYETNEEIDVNDDEFDDDVNGLQENLALQGDIEIQEDIVIDEDVSVHEDMDLDEDAELHELDFEVDEENSDRPVAKPTPMSVKRDGSLLAGTPKRGPFSLKPCAHNVDDQFLQAEKNASVKVTFYKPFGSHSSKTVPVVTLPKKKSLSQINLKNPDQKMLPVCSSKTPEKTKVERNQERNVFAPENIFQSPLIRSSIRQSTGNKVIQQCSRVGRSLRGINKSIEEYLITSFPSPERVDKTEPERGTDPENKVENETKESDASDEKSKAPQMFSKIWTELHTYYDYTEEEEVTFFDRPNDHDDGTSSMMFEDDEPRDTEFHESQRSLADNLTEDKCFSYTGISLLIFKGLLGILKECAPKYSTTVKIPVKDQVLILLMKLKLGMINADLSQKFNIASVTCGKIFSQWLSVFYETLNHMVEWHSRDSTSHSMPEHFYEHLPHTTCLIDFGKISIQMPNKQNGTDENVVKNMTVVKKFLFVVSPNGFVMLVSELFDEDVSDNCIFLKSGVKEKLASGDHVLANREIVDSASLPSDVTFDVLPHLKPENEGHPLCDESKKAVGRLQTFRILRGVITVPQSIASNVVHTCAALSNLGLIH